MYIFKRVDVNRVNTEMDGNSNYLSGIENRLRRLFHTEAKRQSSLSDGNDTAVLPEWKEQVRRLLQMLTSASSECNIKDIEQTLVYLLRHVMNNVMYDDVEFVWKPSLAVTSVEMILGELISHTGCVLTVLHLVSTLVNTVIEQGDVRDTDTIFEVIRAMISWSISDGKPCDAFRYCDEYGNAVRFFNELICFRFDYDTFSPEEKNREQKCRNFIKDVCVRCVGETMSFSERPPSAKEILTARALNEITSHS